MRLRAPGPEAARRRRGATEDDGKAAETTALGRARAARARARVGGEERRRAPRERGRDGLLEPRLDLELGERETLALRPRARERRARHLRAPRASARARRAGRVRSARAPRRRRARSRPRARPRASSAARSSSAGSAAPLRACARATSSSSRSRRASSDDALAPRAEPLPRGAERHERAVRLSGAARELCELAVDGLALATDRVEPLLRLLGRRPLDRARGARGRDVPARPPARSRPRHRAPRRPPRGRPARGAERLVASRALRPLRLREVVAQPVAETARPTRRGPRAARRRPGAGRARRPRPRARPRRPRARPRRARGRARTDASRSCVDATRERRGAPALLRLGTPRSSSAARSSRAIRARSASDLAGQLLRPLGRRRLQRERPQPLPHLLLDVARALDLRRDASELELGAMPSALELAEAGSLLDERAAVLRLRREDRVDLPLRDDRVHRAAEADVGEQLDEVGAAHRRAVDEVLALAAPCEPPRDRELAEVELVAEAAVLVVEHQLDLAVVGRRPRRGAAEEDVVRLLRAKLRRRQRARRPDDRIRRRSTCRSRSARRRPRRPGSRLHLDRVGERLEAAQLDRAQVHRHAEYRAADGRPPAALRRQTSDDRLGRPQRLRAPARRPPARPPSSSSRAAAPSCSPSISAAQTKRRSCGGPSTSSTSYWTARPCARAPPGARSCESTWPVRAYSIRSSNASTIAVLDGSKPYLEVDRGDRSLEQRREHVPAERDPLRARLRDVLRTRRRASSPSPSSRATAAQLCARDDVGADLREPALGSLGKAVVERARDRELEHGVAEELEPLVRRRRGRAPRTCA